MKPYHNKIIYQYDRMRVLTRLPPFNLTRWEALKCIRVGVGIFVAALLKNLIARPGRRFLNSNTKTPPRIWICQLFNLPAPFPIRWPLGFLVKGRCGNVLNHTNRPVMSGFLTAFFKNTLNLKIWREDIRRGCKVLRPQSP